jgi:hypothetical protein
LNFRACEASRRIDGVASHRPSSPRQKTQRASGDGCLHPHGEQGVGDARSQRHRKPPDRSGLWDTALKECRGEKYSRELDNSGNIEGNSNGLFYWPRASPGAVPPRRPSASAHPALPSATPQPRQRTSWTALQAASRALGLQGWRRGYSSRPLAGSRPCSERASLYPFRADGALLRWGCSRAPRH